MIEQDSRATQRGSRGAHVAPEHAPMTRREIREREAREAAVAEAAQAVPTSVAEPLSPVPTRLDPGPMPGPLDGPVPEASPPLPVMEPAPTALTNNRPMTRRERREIDQAQAADESAGHAQVAEAAHTPVGSRAVAEGWQNSQTSPVGSPVPSSGLDDRLAEKPLPPVFQPPFEDAASAYPAVAAENQGGEAELASSREVGPGAMMTHALILPVTPMVDIAGPVGDTGEVLMTAQIPLPRLVAEGNLRGGYDEDEDSFDELVNGETTALTTPMSAISSVSSKGNDSEFQLVRKAPWGSAATVLGASALLLVLAAAGLLGAALLTDTIPWPL